MLFHAHTHTQMNTILNALVCHILWLCIHDSSVEASNDLDNHCCCQSSSNRAHFVFLCHCHCQQEAVKMESGIKLEVVVGWLYLDANKSTWLVRFLKTSLFHPHPFLSHPLRTATSDCWNCNLILYQSHFYTLLSSFWKKKKKKEFFCVFLFDEDYYFIWDMILRIGDLSGRCRLFFCRSNPWRSDGTICCKQRWQIKKTGEKKRTHKDKGNRWTSRASLVSYLVLSVCFSHTNKHSSHLLCTLL